MKSYDEAMPHVLESFGISELKTEHKLRGQYLLRYDLFFFLMSQVIILKEATKTSNLNGNRKQVE